MYINKHATEIGGGQRTTCRLEPGCQSWSQVPSPTEPPFQLPCLIAERLCSIGF